MLTVFVVFPGAVYIIGSWYRQYETAKRVSVFYMAALLASGFGPIVRTKLVQVGTRLMECSLRMHCL
jgi:hypothetical protein